MSTAQIFTVNAATYVFFIVALLIVRMPDVRGTFTEVGWRRLLTGFHIVRERQVLSRLLLGMFLFSLFSLPFVGLFPSIAELNFGFDALGNQYRALYATWGLGAFFGAISVGTWLADVRRHTLIVRGFTGFAVVLAVFSQLRDSFLPYPVGFLLGVRVLHDRHGDHH